MFHRQPGEQADLAAINHSQSNGNTLNGHQLGDTSLNNSDLDDRGRQRKKRDFFGTLKRRLGRSKSRAKSSERNGNATAPSTDSDNPNGELRAMSLDRMRYNSYGNSSGSGGGLTSNTYAGNYWTVFANEVVLFVLRSLVGNFFFYLFV